MKELGELNTKLKKDNTILYVNNWSLLISQVIVGRISKTRLWKLSWIDGLNKQKGVSPTYLINYKDVVELIVSSK